MLGPVSQPFNVHDTSVARKRTHTPFSKSIGQVLWCIMVERANQLLGNTSYIKLILDVPEGK